MDISLPLKYQNQRMIVEKEEESRQALKEEDIVEEINPEEEEMDLAATKDRKKEVIEKILLEAENLLKADLKILQEGEEEKEFNFSFHQQQNLSDNKVQKKQHPQNHLANIFDMIFLPYHLH